MITRKNIIGINLTVFLITLELNDCELIDISDFRIFEHFIII